MAEDTLDLNNKGTFSSLFLLLRFKQILKEERLTENHTDPMEECPEKKRRDQVLEGEC